MANAIGSGTSVPATKVVPSQSASPVEIVPTLNVRVKDGGHDAVINAHEFNPDLHEKVDAKGKADPNAKPTRYELREEIVQPDLDDNDLKELGPPKTKQEKDHLENLAKTHLAKKDQAGKRKLLDEFENVVGTEVAQGGGLQPEFMKAPEAEKAEEKKEATKTNEKAADKIDEKLAAAKHEPPLTPRK